MKRFRYISFFLFALISSASLSGCSDTSSGTIAYYDDSSNIYINPNEKDQIAKDSAEYLIGNIAEKTSICGMDITIKKIFSIGEGSSDNAEIILADVEITNTNSENVEVSAMSNFEITIDKNEPIPGKDLNATLKAREAVSDYVDLNTELEPGQTVRGYINFEASDGWKSISIKFSPNIGVFSYDEITYNITPDMIEKQ